MGIQTEYNPDLALRANDTFGRDRRECLPPQLYTNTIHQFLKRGQRDYWLEGEIPLRETKGNQQLSRPLASIVILEATHFLNPEDGEVWTKGSYKIIEAYQSEDSEIHFEGFEKVK